MFCVAAILVGRLERENKQNFILGLIYGNITIAGEGLQKLGLCSVLTAFEQGGIFIVPHLL
jgi:hypothetical protein